jgi:hypothetical protein
MEGNDMQPYFLLHGQALSIGQWKEILGVVWF